MASDQLSKAGKLADIGELDAISFSSKTLE
jgi:hypothetical protein